MKKIRVEYAEIMTVVFAIIPLIIAVFLCIRPIYYEHHRSQIIANALELYDFERALHYAHSDEDKKEVYSKWVIYCIDKREYDLALRIANENELRQNVYAPTALDQMTQDYIGTKKTPNPKLISTLSGSYYYINNDDDDYLRSRLLDQLPNDLKSVSLSWTNLVDELIYEREFDLAKNLILINSNQDERKKLLEKLNKAMKTQAKDRTLQ